MTTSGRVGSSALVDMAINHIDRLIGEGRIRPGDSIREPDVCAALSLGRVPVREAIRILAGERILELVPNKSARVRMIEPAELLERFELLSWLSALAIQSLVDEGRHADVGKTLKVIARRIEAHGKGDDASLTLREINRFHAATIKACGNRYLHGLIDRMRMNHYSVSVVTVLGHRRINASANKYPLMADSIYRGEGAKAVKILLDRTRTMMREHKREASSRDAAAVQESQVAARATRKKKDLTRAASAAGRSL